MARNEIVVTITRRRGMELLRAMIKVMPQHYKRLHAHNNWWISLYVAIRLAALAFTTPRDLAKKSKAGKTDA